MEYYHKNFKDMILRDYLALDRTKLANERTLLGYIRSFLGLLITGLGLIKFTDDMLLIGVGIAFCFASPPFLIIGIYRYERLRRKLHGIMEINLADKGDIPNAE